MFSYTPVPMGMVLVQEKRIINVSHMYDSVRLGVTVREDTYLGTSTK